MKTHLSQMAARIRPIIMLATLLAALGMPLSATAAEITWQAPADIAAGSEVNTDGTQVYGRCFGIATGSTVNGVKFGYLEPWSVTYSEPALGGQFDSGIGTQTIGNPDAANYKAVLTQTRYWGNSMAITFGNLTVGQKYLFQVWVCDYRPYPNNRTLTVTGTGSNVTPPTLKFLDSDLSNAPGASHGQYVIGTWIADATTMTFTFNGNEGVNLDALQLRALPTMAPVFSPVAGTYIGAQSVTMTSSPGATIYYTTDGTTPTSGSTSGSSPVTVNVPLAATMTIKAYGSLAGYPDSGINSATYTTQAPTAASGTWTNSAGGSWITGGNWSGGTMAYGSGNSADFSTLSLSSDATVNLDASSLSIGTLLFDDQNATKHAWTLNTGSGGPLTLAVSSGLPVIDNKVSTTIGAVLAGTQGLTKTGGGTLTFANTNTYTGSTILNAGALAISSAANLPAASALTLSGGAALSMTAAMTLANNVTIASGQSGNLKNGGAGGNLTLTGDYSGVAGTLNVDPSTSTASYPIFFIQSNNGPALGAVVNVLNHTYTRVDLNNTAYQSFFTNTKLHYDPAINNIYAFNMGNGSTGMNVQIGALDGGGSTTKITSDGRASTLTITGTASGDWGGVIANGLGSGPMITLVKNGDGTQILSGENTYTGSTTVNGGTLQIGNGGATGSLAIGGSIVSNGTLAFNRSDSISQGAHFSANSITGTGGLTQMGPGNLTITASNPYSGTTTVAGGGLIVGVASGSTWNVAHLDLASGTSLTLSNFAGDTVNAAVNVTESLSAHGTGAVTIHVPGTLAVGTYPLIYYPMTSQIGGDGFAAFTLGALPSGVSGHLVNNQEGSSVDLQITAVVTDPFANWIATEYPSLTGDAALPNADPDGDGLNNLAEFAFKGDPTSGSSRGLTAVSTLDSNANSSKELILTVAVRAGATFAGTPSPTVTVDTVTYTIEGSLDLTTFAAPVTELAVALTPAQSGLPDITGSGWEYHSFILTGSEGLPGKGFLRAKAEAP